MSGQTVDGEHLDGLLRCCSLLRQHRQVPAVLIADPAVPGVQAMAAALRATVADYRATDLRLALQPGPFAWSDPMPVTERTQVLQLLTSHRLLRSVFTDVFGPHVGRAMIHDRLPADAMWLAVVRPGRLRVAAVRWSPQSEPTVYYGCSFALTGDGLPLARERTDAAA